MADKYHPVFPPGFWRRIEIHPTPGVVTGGLEDDVHRFHIRLIHENGAITRVGTQEARVPYTTCPSAGAFLAENLTGMSLEDAASIDQRQHCTHLYDLAVLAARLAYTPSPSRFDMRVSDPIEGRTSAALLINGRDAFCWTLNGTLIEDPAPWAGRDLRQLSRWKADFDPTMALHACLLQRAVQISGARRAPEVDRATDRGPGREGVCFTYQIPRVRDALRTRSGRKDFSTGSEVPLHGFDAGRLSVTEWNAE